MVANYLCLIAHAKASNTWSFLVYSESTAFKTLKSLARMTGSDTSVPLEVHDEVYGWLDEYRKRKEQGQLRGRCDVKKEPSTQLPPLPTHTPSSPNHRSASLQSRHEHTSVQHHQHQTPGKRRVQEGPIRGSRDGMDATTLFSRPAPELKDVLWATMRDIVPDSNKKAMASGSKTWAERAVDHANKREREARRLSCSKRQLLVDYEHNWVTCGSS